MTKRTTRSVPFLALALGAVLSLNNPADAQSFRGEEDSANHPAAGPRTTGWTLAQEGMPTMHGAAFGAGRYALVGTYGEIWTSPDGTAWTRQLSPFTVSARGVTFGGGKFVAVGDGGRIMTSPDGLAWTVQPSPTTSSLNAVAFGGGLYVAAGASGRVITSPDGVTWTIRTSNSTRFLRGVTQGGGQFVVVGASREVLTSPDGVTWTVRTPGVPANITTLYGVAYGAGVYVAAAAQGAITSPDGITWTHTMASSQFNYAVTHTGTIFVAVGATTINTSPNGTTWSPSSLNPAPGVSTGFLAVTFGTAGAVATGLDGTVFTSPDALTPWTSRTLPAARRLNGVASDGSGFCAVGSGAFPLGPVSRSADGITWSNGAGLVAASSISRGNGLYVAVGSVAGAAGIATSPDCVTWTDRSVTLPGTTGAYLDGVAFDGGRFVAIGEKYPSTGGIFAIPVIVTSPDGIAWTEVAAQLPTNDWGTLWAVGNGNGLWVAAGFNYNTYEFYLTTSPDGLTWTRQIPTGIPIGNFDYPEDIAYGNGMYVMIGTQIYSSPDAINWTPRLNAFGLDVTYAANQFVAATLTDVHTSGDGINWSLETYPSVHNVFGVGYSAALDRFAVVGDSVIVYAGGGLPQVSIGDLSVAEGNAGTTNASFTVTLSAASTGTVTVAYATANGTATSGQDYVAGSGTVTFPPGTTTQTVTVGVIGDLLDEPDETFFLNLSGPVNATIADAQGIATILDDDAQPAVSIGDCAVVEGNAGPVPCSFTVSLTAPSSFTVSVSYATADGTATAGSDYTAASGSLTFNPGVTTQPVSVSVLGDTVTELDETFLVNLTAPTNATLGDAQGVGTIADDDTTSLSSDELHHGSVRQGDLAVRPDHYRIGQKPYSSYEVVLDATSGDMVPVVLERLAGDNVGVLQSATPIAVGASVSLRWENTTSLTVVNQHIRVDGSCSTPCGLDDTYRIRASDTTYTVPRFNNAGSQITVMIIQNPTSYASTGHLWFWNTAGVLLGTHSFSLGARQTLVLNTATVPGVASQGGTITVSNSARYADLTGKTVALEPSTGFSFDTPMVPKPR